MWTIISANNAITLHRLHRSPRNPAEGGGWKIPQFHHLKAKSLQVVTDLPGDLHQMYSKSGLTLRGYMRNMHSLWLNS